MRRKNLFGIKFNYLSSESTINCNFVNLNGRCVLRYESFLTIFSLKTQQIEVRLVAITIDTFST